MSKLVEWAVDGFKWTVKAVAMLGILWLLLLLNAAPYILAIVIAWWLLT